MCIGIWKRIGLFLYWLVFVVGNILDLEVMVSTLKRTLDMVDGDAM